jgi:type IV pilus assembly protein PilY1
MNLRISMPACVVAVAAALLAVCSATASAQVTYSEDFTGTTTNNQWFFYNGACLTAGTNTSTTSPGYVPSCKTMFANYYNASLPALGKSNTDSFLAGGDLGCLGAAPSIGICSSTITPDLIPTAGNANSGGALRFTNAGGNGSTVGQHQNGAIVSNFTFPSDQGLSITFKTVTYHGDNQGNHGADGISFYLLDGCMPIAGGTVPSTCVANAAYGNSTFSGIGAWGGSLAYTCSNTNPPFHGLAGAYLGLGIDEWGNFLNGTNNTLGETGSTNSGGDNTASGGYYQPGRIGLRGAGNVAWQALTNAYGTYTTSSSPYYPASLRTSCYINGGTIDGNGLCSGNPTDAMQAVQKTCATGNLYNYSTGGTVSSASVKAPTSVGAASLTNAVNTAHILDYTAIPTAYTVLSGVSIANESATIRGSTNVANTSANDANPITYRLKITQDGLLSLSYSFNGGAWQPVIKSQNITTANGTLPSSFRFGFAGSTGGSTNIHEVMCFKATPAETSQSSGSINVYQNPTIKTGTQLFLAYYFPNNWTGQLTAQTVGFDTTQNKVVIGSTPNWDASCVLNGVNTSTGACSTGATSMTAESPSSRVMITWNGTQGIPFEWSNLTAAQQTTLDLGDASQTSYRLDYLRGVRTSELQSNGTCSAPAGLSCLRNRDNVLGDIVDSSPTWVGPPQLQYAGMTTWVDKLYTTATQSENSGQTYAAYQTARQGRLNLVFAGANDGFLHAFRAGSLDGQGNLVANTTTPNDGYEVLAYMPGALLQSAASSTCPASTTDSVAQNIHGVTPVNANCGVAAAAVVPTLDFANTQYSHNWFVDATPATGDLFYAGAWHTWLVGGIGPGGAAFYALDVTDPSVFSESNAASIVLGEWTPSSITCVNVANCGRNLGNTYGTPQVRRFHNGAWGVIFGNGFGSQNGTAGIYIMMVDPSSGARTFYYLATGSSATSNGIASPASLDIDSDHVVDYIYAGDLLGNVWRFDVTSQNPSNWAVSASSPLFTTPGGQPITSRVTVGTLKTVTTTYGLSGNLVSNGPERVIINFGTGRQVPQTVSATAQYASGQQYLFGIWDWDMGTTSTAGTWNNLSPNQQALSLTGPQAISLATLQQQTATVTPAAGSTPAYESISHNVVCWKGSTGCGTPTMMGWYLALPNSGEQVIFDPVLSPDGEFVVNTYIPVQDTPLSCSPGTATGFSMGLQPDSGAGSPTPYFYVSTNTGASTGIQADAVQLNGTGIPSFISSGQQSDQNSEYFITQTATGAAPPTKLNRHSIVTGQRLNWVERR